MTGHFYFALLNPAIAGVLAMTFLVLWQSRRPSPYLLLLAFAFLATGAAFAANDFLAQFEGPLLRIVVNLFFGVAVISACASAVIRVGSRVPVAAFAVTAAIGAGIFCWLRIRWRGQTLIDLRPYSRSCVFCEWLLSAGSVRIKT